MEDETNKKSGGKDKIELPRDGRKRRVGEDGKSQYRRSLRGGFIWIVLFLITLFTVSLLWNRDAGQVEVSYTILREQIEGGNLVSMLIDGKEVRGEFKQAVQVAEQGQTREAKRFKVWLPAEDPELPDKVWAKNPGIEVKSKGEKSNWGGFLLTTFVPILFLVGIMILLLRQMEAGGNRAFSFGRSRAKMIMGDRPETGRADTQGRAPVGRSGDWQDASGAGGRGRGRRAVLQHQRV
jgi:ATP-dependent Zn protease